MASAECKVYTQCDDSPLTIPFDVQACAEDVVLLACRKLGVAPITRSLYALKMRGSPLFMSEASPVVNLGEYDLRIRYKVTNLDHLRTLDKVTYNYMFRQVRYDIINNMVTDIQYKTHKNKLMGLCISDMYRAIQEDKKSVRDLEKNYRMYVPKVLLEKHWILVLIPIRRYLPRMPPKSPEEIKSIYLETFFELAPNYLSEEYDVEFKPFHGSCTRGKIQINPFHSTEPGLRAYDDTNKKWIHVCTIDQLIFLSRKHKDDTLVEICRSNGVYYTLHFKTPAEATSFISGVNGYYRLMVKWTFDLSKVDCTPSLERLSSIKCHGPVGGEFSYDKLSETEDNRHGSYILRKCQQNYDVYYIDYCTQNGMAQTCKVEYVGDPSVAGGYYLLNNDKSRRFDTLENLINSFKDPAGSIYLKKCIAPSEYDKSQLLLCGAQYRAGVRIGKSELQEVLRENRSPRFIDPRDILIYKRNQMRGTNGIMVNFEAIWKLDSRNKREINVALKTLVKEKTDTHSKHFMELASKWASVQSSSVVRLYGLTLLSPTALVMEYLEKGPLDKFLSEHEKKLKPVQLLMGAVGLARALLDLSGAGCVHGRVRCGKVLIAHADSDRISVKLSDPGLHTYTSRDIHWIPVDLHEDMEAARHVATADIWAFGTTLWEIFSYGLSPVNINPQFSKLAYKRGERLSCPPECPKEVWEVVRKCWLEEPHKRPTPQLIMRDISYQLEIINSYGEIKSVTCPRNLRETLQSDKMEGGDDTSVRSQDTRRSSLTTNSCDTPELAFEELPNEPSDDQLMMEPDVHNMQWIRDMGSRSTVTLNKRIGHGYYGEVYKARLENLDTTRVQEVAVKRLKDNCNGSLKNDFIAEFEVMKSLKHPNIIEILGICKDREMMIVMQYVRHGALSSYLSINRHICDSSTLLKYACDVAEGMDYLSAKGVVHRDLAARNILVKDHRHVMISDFGLARFTSDNNKYTMTRQRQLPIKWYAPEVIANPVFSRESDVWSYGVTVWEMFTYCSRDVPDFDESRPEERARVFEIPEGCPEPVYRDLMLACWHLDPEQRPNFTSLGQECEKLMRIYGS